MADQINRIPASQQLRDVASKQEGVLEGVNTFQPESNEYSANNKEVLLAENGTKVDVQVRNQLEAINFYNESNEYKSPE